MLPMKTLLFKHIDIISEINHHGSSWEWGYREIPSEMPLCATYLRSKGYQVTCLDIGKDSDLPDDPFDLIVYWISIFYLDRYVPGLQKIKQRHPRSQIALVVNDTFADLDGIILERYPFVDFIIRRYNREKVLEELLRNNLCPEKLETGIVYRHEQKIVSTEEHPLGSYAHLRSCRAVLAELAPQRYQHFIFATQQGCPQRCIFCLISNRKPVYRNVADLIDEISFLYTYRPAASYKLAAPALLLNPQWVRDFCSELSQRNLHIRWDTDIRADFARSDENLETLRIMHKAGCERLYIGAETYDPEAMVRLNKRYEVESLIKTSQLLIEMGFMVTHQMLLGVPGDSGRSYTKTHDLITALPLAIGHNFQILRPYRGTVARQRAEEMGVIRADFDDFAAVQNYVDQAVIGTGPLSKKEVNTWHRTFKYLRYYRQIKLRLQKGTAQPVLDRIKLGVAFCLWRYFHHNAAKS